MYFVAFANDKPGMEEVRAAVRPSHRRFLRQHGHPVKVLLGGPMLDEKSQKMNGTMLVIEADCIEQVEDFVKQDPYIEAGLFETLNVRPWAWGLGAPEE